LERLRGVCRIVSGGIRLKVFLMLLSVPHHARTRRG